MPFAVVHVTARQAGSVAGTPARLWYLTALKGVGTPAGREGVRTHCTPPLPSPTHAPLKTPCPSCVMTLALPCMISPACATTPPNTSNMHCRPAGKSRAVTPCRCASWFYGIHRPPHRASERTQADAEYRNATSKPRNNFARYARILWCTGTRADYNTTGRVSFQLIHCVRVRSVVPSYDASVLLTLSLTSDFVMTKDSHPSS